MICQDHAEKTTCASNHDLDLQNVIITSHVNVQLPNPRDENPTCHCEIGNCKGEVYSACPKCLRYVCFVHLDQSMGYNDHNMEINDVTLNDLNSSTNQDIHVTINKKQNLQLSDANDVALPESFEVEGNRKEGMSES